MHEMWDARSLRFSRNQRVRFAKPGSLSSLPSSMNSTAKSGMTPTIERSLRGTEAPSDQELVVVEPVLLVPEARAPEAVHRVRDRDEVLEELRGDVLVGRIALGQLEGHREHGAAVERHPRRSVRLLELAAPGQRLRPVEDAHVVQAEEPAAEDVPAAHVLAVHPPCEVDDQLLEDPREERPVALAARRRDLVHAPAGPGVHGRVDVGEIPLVGGDLPVGVHVPLAQEEVELLLGERRVEPRHRATCGTRGPRRRTRDTPTCRASR